MIDRTVDITGMRFSKLTVLGYRGPATADGRPWKCVCDCGNNVNASRSRLMSGHTRSCGCIKREVAAANVKKLSLKHGLYETRVFKVWSSMIERCGNPSHPAYSQYGGRGITVCNRWLSSVERFLEDMGHPPDGLSIDRIDNDGNYEPGNCRWASRKEQSRNRRTNRIIEFRGERLCLMEWAERLGISFQTLRHRFLRGWSVEDALTMPPVSFVDSGRRSGAARRKRSEIVMQIEAGEIQS